MPTCKHDVPLIHTLSPLHFSTWVFAMNLSSIHRHSELLYRNGNHSGEWLKKPINRLIGLQVACRQ
jgi:hypothetical protein